ncbi:MAG: PilZ domain-containing protein [Pseudomonadales bacterium]
MDKRSETRIAHDIRFFVQVHECKENPDLVGESVACAAVDFSPHGLQFRTEEALIPGSLLNITIGIGEPSVRYLLRGEIRWVRNNDGKHAMGILLQDTVDTDFETWISGFDEIFAA